MLSWKIISMSFNCDTFLFSYFVIIFFPGLSAGSLVLGSFLNIPQFLLLSSRTTKTIAACTLRFSGVLFLFLPLSAFLLNVSFFISIVTTLPNFHFTLDGFSAFDPWLVSAEISRGPNRSGLFRRPHYEPFSSARVGFDGGHCLFKPRFQHLHLLSSLSLTSARHRAALLRLLGHKC